MAPKKVQSTVRNYEAGIHKFFSINGATNRTSLNQITNSTLTEVFRITEGKVITNNLTISGGVNFTDGNILTSNLIVSGNIQFNNTSLKNNIQVTPLRQVFNVQTDTQSLFTLSTEGIYGGEASNAQVFIGQRLLRYYDSNIKDYDLTILRNVDPPITNYTITLSQPAVLGNYVDVTVFPQLLPESTPQGFVYQNVVLDADSFTTFAKNGNQIYYNNGNVGIGTANPTQKLHVEGNIVCSNISVIGDFVTLNNITSNTEQVVVENAGTGPALKVTQTGNNSVAEFYDKESGLAMIVGNNGNIGIGTNNPQAKLHIFNTNGIIIPSGSTIQRPTNPSSGYIRFNNDYGFNVLEYYSGVSWVSIGIADGSSYINAAPSASYIKQITGTVTDGLYWIHIPYIGPIQVYCDMNTNGGGWMHCGTFSDNNENRGEVTSTAQQSGGNHPWGAPLNAAQNSGIWEDITTLGTQSFTADFKNHVWNYYSMTQMLMKDQGNTLRNLFYTNAISSQTLGSFFATRTWGAIASDTSSAAYTNNRVYGLGITNFGVVDPVLESGNKSVMLFKFGEINGVQDANKDRAMIAGHYWNATNSIDNPYGIGCIMSTTTNQYWRDIVPVAQNADIPPVNITGGPYNYTMWIR